MDAPESTALNEHQQRRLVVTAQYVDKLLGDLERAFVEARSNSPFARYVNDLAPAEQRLVLDYIGRIRTQLVRMLAGQGLSPTPSRVGVRHGILTHLAYVDVAVEELKPRFMAGYGAVAGEASDALNGIVEELHGTIGQLTRSLAARQSEDLRERLARIGPAADTALLALLEDLVEAYGLVEFRGALATIVETLERRGLELAVFGRVSTGKSSLLNRLLGRDVLPVGVTPITAVPTRIAFGREPRLRVWFADAPPRVLDVDALPEYASERENPANAKRVLRLVVELPAPFLESGVTLVDTPGLGSLATSGAAETLAYLPHCDVAAVLVDAGSTVTSDDLATIASLADAGIRASVLVSKADLIDEGDLARTIDYVREAVRRELGVDVTVGAVSVRPDHAALFQRWRDAELEPLIVDQERERQRAAARKTEILRAQVEGALRQRLAAGTTAESRPDPGGTRDADTKLQTAAGRITVVEQHLSHLDLRLPRRSPEVLARAAELIGRRHDPQESLARAFREVAGEESRAVLIELQELVEALRAAAREVSASVQWAGGDERGAGGAAFREVPVPELPPGLTVPSEGVERILGGSVARSIVVKRLEHAVGEPLQATLDSYASVLRRWALDSLADVRAGWAATTDALRAHLDRAAGHGQEAAAPARDVERDLHRLGAFGDPADPAAAGAGVDHA
jgi:GTP-binding protein EngB required for normal cell division